MLTIRKGIENTFSITSWAMFGFFILFTLVAQSSVHASHTPKIVNLNTGDEFTDLQIAIDLAASGNTLKIDGNIVGVFVVFKDLTILGDHSVIDGGNAAPVFTVFTPAGATQSISVVFQDLIIQNGLGSSTQGGGGILNINANLLLRSVKVLHNESLANGGGILNATITSFPVTPPFSLSFPAVLSLTKCKVSYNTAISGGGIVNSGGLMTVEDSKISGNVATNVGGGILSAHGNNIFTNSRISSNYANLQGGGIENIIGSITTFDDVKFINNHAGQAGGIYNGTGGVAGSSVTIRDSAFHGNNTFTAGGALFNDANSLADLNDVKITRNSAFNAGGIFNNAGATLILVETVVENNLPNNIVDL